MKRMGTNNAFSTEVSVRGMENILGLFFSSSLLNSAHTSQISDIYLYLRKFVGFGGSKC